MGHVVLVGSYGTGRRTLARLAIKVAYNEIQTDLLKCIQSGNSSFITEDLQLAEDLMQGYLPAALDDGETELSNLHVIAITQDMNFRQFPKIRQATIICLSKWS